ncbi:MAG: hypothetical protein JST08_20000 [Actinobacteria bacterium]|nr:hypothetical protein [Actinomycetota bacterium]
MDVERSSSPFSDGVDPVLVEQTLRIERECCPLFDLGFDTDRSVLMIGLPSPEMEPARAVISFALGTHPRH